MKKLIMFMLCFIGTVFASIEKPEEKDGVDWKNATEY